MLESMLWWVTGLWSIPFWYYWVIPVLIILFSFAIVFSLLGFLQRR